jgi:hypothetical protein
MSDDFVQVPLDSTGKKVDCSVLTTSGGTVERQRCAIGDDTDPAALAKVGNAQPASNAYGLAVRPIPGAAQPVYLVAPVTALSEASINFSASGLNPVVVGIALQTIKVWKLWLQVNGNVSLTFKSGGTALGGSLTLAQGGSWIFPRDGDPWFTCGVAENFGIDADAAVQVSGRAYYTQE